jgi:uncharacterized phage protein (TIGR02220 family)
MTEKKSYYAIIPANVRYDKLLPPNAKLLYGEITALCNERGYCWAENRYFAELYGVSKTSVSKWISALCERGYINTALEYKDGCKEIDKRYITIVKDPIEEKLNTYPTKVKDPIEEKLKDNTTLSNTTNTTVIDIVDYLNCRIGSAFKHTTKATQKVIKARLAEGFAFEDFQTVIDKKAQEWLGDPKMEQYLRPETLFGTKFEGYLNARVSKKTDRRIPDAIKNRVSDVDNW